IVNDNIQLVNMWLSMDESTTLDNALITMEHLYKTGTVHIYLQRLINQQSRVEIKYYIEKRRNTNPNDDNNVDGKQEKNEEKLEVIMTMSDIYEHKRQLTFSNVDLTDNMLHKRLLLNEQLKVLNVVEKIYSILSKAETSGHPVYQLKNEKYEIYDRT
ncbi:unnamed protein product, partial [Didymodactylos carnosus]